MTQYDVPNVLKHKYFDKIMIKMVYVHFIICYTLSFGKYKTITKASKL